MQQGLANITRLKVHPVRELRVLCQDTRRRCMSYDTGTRLCEYALSYAMADDFTYVPRVDTRRFGDLLERCLRANRESLGKTIAYYGMLAENIRALFSL